MNNFDDLFELLKIPSPSYSEDEVSEYLKNRLESFNFKVFEDAFGNLIAKRGFEESLPTILLSMHMDTVENAVEAKPEVYNGYIRGDGNSALGLDDKVAIFALFEALNKVSSTLNLVININRCEEVGLMGSRNLDYSLLGKVDYAFILDATGKINTVIEQAPGKIINKAIFIGKKAHAGFEPEKGISAIMMASSAISKMKLLRIDEETTANIGSFKANGGTNVVCDRAEIVWEVRSRNKDKLNKIDENLKSVCLQSADEFAGKVLIEKINYYNPYKIDRDEKGVEFLKNRLNTQLNFTVTGGGSDCNNYREHGIMALVLAIGYNYPHSEKESIEISQLEKLIDLIVKLIKR